MADWANLPRDRWSDIESGVSFNVAELGRIARALAVDPGTLLRGEEGSPRRSVARFRQAADPLKKPESAEIRALALAAELGRIGGALHRLLSKPLPLVDVRQPISINSYEESWKQGYRLGEKARNLLGISAGPIVDLQKLFETLGIHITTLEIGRETIDAASMVEAGAVPIILLNKASGHVMSPLPRRATMAHELCHILHDAGDHDLATQLSGDHVDDFVEQRARAFAPAFLAPPSQVRQWFDEGEGRRQKNPHDKVLELATRWGMSWSAAVWHAKNCRLILTKTARRLLELGVEQDWHLAFEHAIPQSQSILADVDVHPLCRGRMAKLVLEAFEVGVISEGRAREILTWG